MSTSQLEMLTDLARGARDQAGKVLAQERQTEQQTTAQLQSLLSYRAEYAERLQKAMRDGIDPATMYNYLKSTVAVNVMNKKLTMTW